MAHTCWAQRHGHGSARRGLQSGCREPATSTARRSAYNIERRLIKRRWRLSFYEHWARKLAGAAVFGDARVTVKHVDALIARAMRVALPPAPPAVGDPITYPPLPPSLPVASICVLGTISYFSRMGVREAARRDDTLTTPTLSVRGPWVEACRVSLLWCPASSPIAVDTSLVA